MFSQWLLAICSLLFVSGTGSTAGVTTHTRTNEVGEVCRIVQADTQYGWQVSGSSVSAYDVPAK